MYPGKVTFLDDSEDLRIMVSRILKSKLGIECLLLSSVDDLIAHSDEVLDSDLAILDINLGADRSGIDASKWLHEHDYKGKILFLSGYDDSNPLVAEAHKEGSEVYQKPLPTDKLVSIVDQSIKH